MKVVYPNAEIAMLAMTWREDNGPRESSWNDQVFGDPSLLAHIDAATLHPYFGISWPASGGKGGANNSDSNRNSNSNSNSSDRKKDASPATSITANAAGVAGVAGVAGGAGVASAGDGKYSACGKTGVGASGLWIATEKASSACECAQHCTAMSQSCRAWQWMDDKTGDCYLKSTPTMAPNSGSVSGVGACSAHTHTPCSLSPSLSLSLSLASSLLLSIFFPLVNACSRDLPSNRRGFIYA